jgi:membrane-associated protein
MQAFRQFLDIFLHLRENVGTLIGQYGTHIYTIFFIVIFIETGLVIWPFLPGDSLLFTAGAFAALGKLNIFLMFVVLSLAAIIGDSVNYAIGHYLGPKVFKWQKSRWFNPEHLKRTHALYEKYGGKIIILARFMPFIRTYAPFVAGIGAMTYRTFILYNVIGGVSWVAVCLTAGYWFGNIPWVSKHFEMVIIGIIFISLLPMIVEYLRHRSGSAKKAPESK